jgi:predicted dinucleotide-binding enzyme
LKRKPASEWGAGFRFINEIVSGNRDFDYRLRPFVAFFFAGAALAGAALVPLPFVAAPGTAEPVVTGLIPPTVAVGAAVEGRALSSAFAGTSGAATVGSALKASRKVCAFSGAPVRYFQNDSNCGYV